MCHYSHHLTNNIISDRAVPLLATLFLLSFTKLLRNIVAIHEFGMLTSYPDMATTIVWYLDGNMTPPYLPLSCSHGHLYLLSLFHNLFTPDTMLEKNLTPKATEVDKQIHSFL